MTKNFHEQYAIDEQPLPSERSTGLVFAAAALAVAYLGRADPLALASGISIAAIFLAASFLYPTALRPLNVFWFKLAMLLNKVLSPVIMLVLFMVVIVPYGLIMQLARDPLRKRRLTGLKSSSYWISRETEKHSSDMSHQF